MQEEAERVVIGMDPHKRSATIEVMAAGETILGGGRYATDEAGFAAMTDYVNRLRPHVEDRVWAVEGCNGIGHHIAMRLLAAGEQVIDVPPKLSARARVFATGQGRKTDATDAHSVALVGTRMAGLRPVVNDEQLAVLRVLVDRRRSLGEECGTEHPARGDVTRLRRPAALFSLYRLMERSPLFGASHEGILGASHMWTAGCGSIGPAPPGRSQRGPLLQPRDG